MVTPYCAAVAELEVCDLQLGALAAEHGPVLAPVGQRSDAQWHHAEVGRTGFHCQIGAHGQGARLRIERPSVKQEHESRAFEVL